jgi:hypothetical protein
MMSQSTDKASASEKPPAVRRPDKELRRCTYCGATSPLVWVHGHGQCANCGINVEECCQGESCQKTT